MNPTKISLSKQEMQLVTNADWILTKNGIIQKVKWLLGTLQAKQEACLQSHKKHLPAEVLKPSPKISRGENYKGLPYLVLDCPRYFHKENIFAIRTMFWWGNFFSITLHLSGKYKKMYEEKLIASFKALQEKDFFVCVGMQEWEHDFEKPNYIPVKELSKMRFRQLIQKCPFIKVGQKIPLQEWNTVQKILFGYFRRMLEILPA